MNNLETYEILEILVEKIYSDEENWRDYFKDNFYSNDEIEWEEKINEMDAGTLRDFYYDRYFSGFYD